MLCDKDINKFDTRSEDEKIANAIYQHLEKTFSDKINNKHIAILATEFYDTGGHTECVRRLVQNLSDTYDIQVFLTKKMGAYSQAPNKMKAIQSHAKIDGLDCHNHNDLTAISIMFNLIKGYAPKVLFVFMHMNDVYSTAILALIKKYTNIKIVYFNHASHYSALGFSLADLILVALPSTHYVDKHYRKIDRHYILELFSDKIEDIKYSSQSDIAAKKIELGIGTDEYCTMSGADCYKFFEENGESPYFEMIKRLLIKEKKLKHVIISVFNNQQKQVIDNIFREQSLKERLIFVPYTSDYQILFESCDVFIDSCPVSSALTQIDLMKLKKPTVVKVNNKNALWSFHEYMPKNYPYMFDNLEDMENGILKLLQSKEEQKRVIDINFQHYMQKFEGNAVKQKYIHLIENITNIEQFYTKIDESLTYNLKT